MEETPPKRINIQEHLQNLTKHTWYSISNQDSYLVYIDKNGHVYDEDGFYMETLKQK